MTRAEIKDRMITVICDTLREELDEDKLLSKISVDAVNDFMWEKDWGKGLAEQYIDEHIDELANDLLESIYSEIDDIDLCCWL